MRSSLSYLLPLLLSLPGSCATPARRNPMFDQKLLPPVELRGAVRQEAVLNLLPVLDERPLERDEMSAAEAALLPAASQLVYDYLLRELRAAHLMSEVIAGRYLKSEFSLRVSLLAFEGGAGGGLHSGSGYGRIELRARLDRRADGCTLLDRRYLQHATEETLFRAEPEALALVCRALNAAVAELLLDLSRVDLTRAPAAPAAPAAPVAPAEKER